MLKYFLLVPYTNPAHIPHVNENFGNFAVLIHREHVQENESVVIQNIIKNLQKVQAYDTIINTVFKNCLLIVLFILLTSSMQF